MLWSITLSLLLTIGCNSLDAATKEVLRSIQKTGELQSYRSSANSLSHMNNEISIIHNESEVASPDFFRSKTAIAREYVGNETHKSVREAEDALYYYFHDETAIDPDEMEFIKVGDECYSRAGDGEWQECMGTTCECKHITFERSLGFLHYIEVEQVTEKDKTIDGTECRYYRGTVDVDSWVKEFDESPFDEMDTELYQEYQEYLAQLSQSEITAQLWIDDNNYINQLKLDIFYPYDDPETGEKKWGSIISMTTYSAFNEDIQVARPI
jgi:hypothetical protein